MVLAESPFAFPLQRWRALVCLPVSWCLPTMFLFPLLVAFSSFRSPSSFLNQVPRLLAATHKRPLFHCLYDAWRSSLIRIRHIIICVRIPVALSPVLDTPAASASGLPERLLWKFLWCFPVRQSLKFSSFSLYNRTCLTKVTQYAGCMPTCHPCPIKNVHPHLGLLHLSTFLCFS